MEKGSFKPEKAAVPFLSAAIALLTQNPPCQREKTAEKKFHDFPHDDSRAARYNRNGRRRGAPLKGQGVVALAESLGMRAVPVETTAAETWYLIFTHSGSTLQYCLDAKLQTIGNGGTVQLWDYNGGPQQRWSLVVP